MAEGKVHGALKDMALHYLKDKVVDIVAQEVKFSRIRARADAVGINLKRKEIRIIEVKATREDYMRDAKLFDEKTSYHRHAHYAYILTPTGVVKPEELPYGYGLLWEEAGGLKVIRNPLKNQHPLLTRYDTTLKRTVRRLTNALLYGKTAVNHD